MTILEELEQFAYDRDISIISFESDEFEAIAMKIKKHFGIGINMSRTRPQEKIVLELIHELGHIETSSLLAFCAAYEPASRLEYRAWKWAIRKLLPEARLAQVIRDCQGCMWEVAEEFDVTPEFVERAIAFYKLKDPTFLQAEKNK